MYINKHYTMGNCQKRKPNINKNNNIDNEFIEMWINSIVDVRKKQKIYKYKPNNPNKNRSRFICL